LTKPKTGYSSQAILKAFEEVMVRFEQQRITGRITPIIDVSQGTISGAKIRQEVGITK